MTKKKTHFILSKTTEKQFDKLIAELKLGFSDAVAARFSKQFFYTLDLILENPEMFPKSKNNPKIRR